MSNCRLRKRRWRSRTNKYTAQLTPTKTHFTVQFYTHFHGPPPSFIFSSLLPLPPSFSSLPISLFPSFYSHVPILLSSHSPDPFLPLPIPFVSSLPSLVFFLPLSCLFPSLILLSLLNSSSPPTPFPTCPPLPSHLLSSHSVLSLLSLPSDRLRCFSLDSWQKCRL